MSPIYYQYYWFKTSVLPTVAHHTIGSTCLSSFWWRVTKTLPPKYLIGDTPNAMNFIRPKLAALNKRTLKINFVVPMVN